MTENEYKEKIAARDARLRYLISEVQRVKEENIIQLGRLDAKKLRKQ